MKKLNLCLLIFFITTTLARAQGTFVYDQESSSDESFPIGGPRIQFYGTVGQSFSPSLATVGFVRLKLGDTTPGNALGATLLVNLRSTSISGPILGTATPVFLDDGFAGSVNFFFAAAVPVTPSTTYFFETVVQSGDNWGITGLGDSYAGGIFYGGAQPFSGNDLWFREGIVVPEPSSVSLLFLGSGLAAWLARRKSWS